MKTKNFLKAVQNAKEKGTALHMYGLLSDGGVHSHITHVFGLLELAKRQGLEKVYVHCFLDGRDTPPESGKGYVEQLTAKMRRAGRRELGRSGHDLRPLLRHGPGQPLGTEWRRRLTGP